MRLNYCAGIVTIVLLCSGNLRAQYAHFVPVTAKTRLTEETVRNGRVIKKQVKEGVYYRNDDGWFLKRFTGIDGDEQAALRAGGQLWDNHTAIAYRLDYVARTATEREHGSGPMQPQVTDPQAASKLPDDSVEGICCKVYPAKYMRTGQTALEDIGQSCRSVEYYLTLRWDKTYKSDNGDTFHSVFQMYDIHIGSEPDPKLFDLQGTFTVYRPEKSQRERLPPNQ
jgi:hypothetical protein